MALVLAGLGRGGSKRLLFDFLRAETSIWLLFSLAGTLKMEVSRWLPLPPNTGCSQQHDKFIWIPVASFKPLFAIFGSSMKKVAFGGG